MSDNNLPSISLASLSHIKTNLDRLFKKGMWKTWELETISDELNIAMDELTRDKISLLQILEQNPKSLLTDNLLFLYATEVINNKTADFGYLPMPTSLELAFAISEIKKVTGINNLELLNSSLQQVAVYLLIEEGYSEPLEPFDFIPKGILHKGQLPIDIEAKKRAIASYIHNMENL